MVVFNNEFETEIETDNIKKKHSCEIMFVSERNCLLRVLLINSTV